MNNAQITNTAALQEMTKIALMSNEEVKQNWMLWSMRAGQLSVALEGCYTTAMMTIYTREFFARGLNVAYVNAGKTTKRAK